MEIVLLLVIIGFLVRVFRRRTETEGPPELGAVGWSATTNWRVVPPLARVEVRRLLRHPALLAGVVLTPFIFLLATADENFADGTETWSEMSPGIALGLVPFGWMVVIAAHLATSRPTRTGTDTLFATLPTPQPARTAGLLSTAVGSFGVATVLAVGWVVFLQGQDRLITGSPQWAEIGAGLLIAAGSVTVGVAVARLLPHPMFGVVGAVTCAFLQARFLDTTTWPWNRSQGSPYRFLGFLAEPTSGDPAFEIRPAGWHLVYLLGLIAVMACVAMAIRTGLPRVLAGSLAMAVSVTALAGWVQTRPPTDQQVAGMLRHLYEPALSQTCEDAGTVRYCADDISLRRVRAWRAGVESVLALMPTAVSRRPLTVSDRVPTVIGDKDCAPIPFTDTLVPEVASRVDPERVWPADGAIHPGVDEFPCGGGTANGLFLAVQTGAWAVGLPSSPRGRDERCTADRQARSVVALWLGAAAVPEGKRHLRTMLTEEQAGHLRFAGWNDPPMWGVRFAKPDVSMALDMLALPTAAVVETLGANWRAITDRATPAATLGTLLGMKSIGRAVAESATCP